MRTISFAKGHGTLNDFVIVVDRHNATPLSDDEVRLLCDRHAGIGADGLLRAVKAEHFPEWDGDGSLWFMDYRNADGSLAEMCGNGTRVFARHLSDANLVNEVDFDIATRAGVRGIHLHSDGSISTRMGRVHVSDEDVTIRLGDRTWPARKVDVGNPHAVVVLHDDEALSELDLTQMPSWAPAEAFPHGVNVEFVREVAPGHLAMRVHERGAGETLSCGTGTVAVAAAHAGVTSGAVVRVDVAGGVLKVTLDGDQATLTGPAVIVARGEVTLPDLPQGV